jgi:hypothetical protein
VLRSAYIETSVVSYLTARRNQRDLIVAAHQELTREWWENRRQELALFASWNCTHLANAVMIPRVNNICRAAGFEPPYICTPEELMVG